MAESKSLSELCTELDQRKTELQKERTWSWAVNTLLMHLEAYEKIATQKGLSSSEKVCQDSILKLLDKSHPDFPKSVFESGEYFYFQGRLERFRGRTKKSREFYQKAAKFPSYSFMAQYRLSQIAYDEKKVLEEIRYLKGLVHLLVDNEENKILQESSFARLIELSQGPAAFAMAQRWADFYPRSVRAKRALFWESLSLERLGQARQLLESLKEQNSDTSYEMEEAKLLKKEKKWPEALKLFLVLGRALSEESLVSTGIEADIIECFRELKKYEEMRKYSIELLKKRPEDYLAAQALDEALIGGAVAEKETMSDLEALNEWHPKSLVIPNLMLRQLSVFPENEKEEEKTERLEKIAKLSRRLLATQPENIDHLYFHAEYLFQAGIFSKAFPPILQALERIKNGEESPSRMSLSKFWILAARIQAARAKVGEARSLLLEGLQGSVLRRDQVAIKSWLHRMNR